jgi:hypothetical protein
MIVCSTIVPTIESVPRIRYDIPPAQIHEQIDQSQSAQLRAIFFAGESIYGEESSGYNFHVAYNKVSESLDLDTNPEKDLVKTIGNLRSMLWTRFRIRGTSEGYYNQAVAQGLISTKFVEDLLEHDKGMVASYLINPIDTHIDNKEFLYWLQFSVLGAVQYGLEHTDWESAVFLDAKSSEILPVPKDGVNISIFFADKTLWRANTYQIVAEKLHENGSFPRNPGEQPFRYLSLPEQSFLWGGKPRRVFTESGFEQKGGLSEYAPREIKISKQQILDKVKAIFTLDSEENRIYHKIRAMIEKSELAKDKVLFSVDSQSFLDTLLYLLSEDATLQTIDVLKGMALENPYMWSGS